MRRLLIANRGEIARRIMRTARSKGIACVVPVCEVDLDLPHIAEADHVVPVASPRAFVDAELIARIAVEHGADAVHPGYGFLSESADLAHRVIDSGLTWVGPSPQVIALMGDKAAARQAIQLAGVQVLPGSDGPVVDLEHAHRVAEDIGYPLIVKPSAGGGGIGMGVVHGPHELAAAIDTARSRGRLVFSDDALVVERYIRRARHIEVQVIGLSTGDVVTLAERDCSVQRRHQKVVEESPSPVVDAALRARLQDAARVVSSAVGYRNVGTVEFLLDRDTQEFYFLEMNTRLQVEHGISELVHGVDLVDIQLDIAAGEEPRLPMDSAASGHAVEVRVYAEDPVTFRPGPGRIAAWVEPTGAGVRVDAGYKADTNITPYFDPMLAKVMAWGADREEAIRRLRSAVDDFVVDAPHVNLPLLSAVLGDVRFTSGDFDTRLLDQLTLPVD